MALPDFLAMVRAMEPAELLDALPHLTRGQLADIQDDADDAQGKPYLSWAVHAALADLLAVPLPLDDTPSPILNPRDMVAVYDDRQAAGEALFHPQDAIRKGLPMVDQDRVGRAVSRSRNGTAQPHSLERIEAEDTAEVEDFRDELLADLAARRAEGSTVNALMSPKDRLLRNIATIKDGLESIERHGHAVALAIREVYQEKQWALTHTAFDAWFVDTFKKDRSRGYQLLKWANLSTLVDNERHGRELAGLEPDVQAQVIEQAGENPTAAKLREARERVQIDTAAQAEDAAKQRPEAPQRRGSRDLGERMESWARLGRKLIERHYHDVSPEALERLDGLMRTLRGSTEV